MQAAGHTAATAALLLCKLPWLQAVLLFILDSEGSFDLPLGSVSVQCRLRVLAGNCTLGGG